MAHPLVGYEVAHLLKMRLFIVWRCGGSLVGGLEMWWLIGWRSGGLLVIRCGGSLVRIYDGSLGWRCGGSLVRIYDGSLGWRWGGSLVGEVVAHW